MKKNYIKLLYFSISSLSIFLLLNCESEENIDNNESVLYHEIYYRWTENLNHPSDSNASNCDESVGEYYTNTHPNIPDKAIKNQYYKVSPGSFTVNLGTKGGSATKYISAPANGYRRYYTHMIKKYFPENNRCLIVMHIDNEFTYVDEPIK